MCSACKPGLPVILIVDDDANIRGVCRELFEEEGFNVLTAENGSLALKLLRTHSPPSIALVDLTMPVMNGWEFVEAIRDGKNSPPFPIVVVSGEGSEQALFNEAAYLRKPVDPQTLLKLVKRFCPS